MTDSLPSSTGTPRFLWAAVGILGVTTLAMGAALVQGQSHPTTMQAAQTLSAPGLPPVSTAIESVPAVAATPALASVQKRTLAPVKSAQAATKTIAHKPTHTATQAPSQAPSPAVPEPVAVTTEWPADPPVVAKAAKPVCTHCGKVQSVTPLQRDANEGSGLGVLAGAVLGGLVGNQFGGGDGKTVATIAGAVGGGWAGNTVEKRMKKETVYQVDVRMEDGSTQRIEQRNPIAVGEPVTVEGGVIRL